MNRCDTRYVTITISCSTAVGFEAAGRVRQPDRETTRETRRDHPDRTTTRMTSIGYPIFSRTCLKTRTVTPSGWGYWNMCLAEVKSLKRQRMNEPSKLLLVLYDSVLVKVMNVLTEAVRCLDRHSSLSDVIRFIQCLECSPIHRNRCATLYEILTAFQYFVLLQQWIQIQLYVADARTSRTG